MRLTITTDDGELLEILEHVEDRIASPMARGDLTSEIIDIIRTNLHKA